MRKAMRAISFFGQTFINDGKAGKAHQLAVALLKGQLSYPTVVFLTKQDDKFQVSPVPGFRQPKDMEMLLTFLPTKHMRHRSGRNTRVLLRGR